MLKRLYIHNYKSFQNFELRLEDAGSTLFLGKNGAGKSSLIEVFHILQKIGEEEARLDTLIRKTDFNLNQPELPMTFELELELNAPNSEPISANCTAETITATYHIETDYPASFQKPRVLVERFSVDGSDIFTRDKGDIQMFDLKHSPIADFFLDWHSLALPIFNPRKEERNIVSEFKRWLSKIVVLSPIPALMASESRELAEKPDIYAQNISAWVTDLFSQSPKSYTHIYDYLHNTFPDLVEITNPKTSETSHKLGFIFHHENAQIKLDLEQLSSGEKIFLLWACILSSAKLGKISLCVWDEPDIYISLLEIQHYFSQLRKAFYHDAQFILTTHNPETIRNFPSDNIKILHRDNHLAPTQLKTIENPKYDIVEMIELGEIDL